MGEVKRILAEAEPVIVGEVTRMRLTRHEGVGLLAAYERRMPLSLDAKAARALADALEAIVDTETTEELVAWLINVKGGE